MANLNPYAHRLKLDKQIRIATDNVSGQNMNPEYNPVKPPIEGYFLLLNGTPMLLLNGQNLDLL